MTPSCPSSRRRSSGRWRRLTEIWEREDDTELGKNKMTKEIGRENRGLDRNSAVRKRVKESRKREGAMCDRGEIVLHGRSLSIKEEDIFTDYLDVGIVPGSNPHKAKKPGHKKQRKGT